MLGFQPKNILPFIKCQLNTLHKITNINYSEPVWNHYFSIVPMIPKWLGTNEVENSENKDPFHSKEKQTIFNFTETCTSDEDLKRLKRFISKHQLTEESARNLISIEANDLDMWGKQRAFWSRKGFRRSRNSNYVKEHKKRLGKSESGTVNWNVGSICDRQWAGGSVSECQ